MGDNKGGGAPGGGPLKPQDVAHEIVSAADFRFGHMHVHQLPSSPLGVLRAGASRLAHVEQRDTGRVQPGGLAAQAQSAAGAVMRGEESDVAGCVEEEMRRRGLKQGTFKIFG